MLDHCFSIKDYPLVIEPMVQCLEGRAGYRVGAMPDLEAPGAWTPLYRLSLAVVAPHLTLPPYIGHLFGDDHTFAKCHLVLGYDSGGGLSHLCLRDERGWDCQELAEELTLKPVRHPSVRLVFRDDVARRRFLERELRGKEAELGLMGAPRLVEVWTLPEGA